MELERYGVRSNAIAPAARTRLTEQTPGLVDEVRPPDDVDAFDEWHPGNVSPVVAYLAQADCAVTGEVFHVRGGTVTRFLGWTAGAAAVKGGRWTAQELTGEIPRLLRP
jgi:NAD(P)-dependent dehydrogenase (short-subunit alcohol dehydrogenase family)